MSLAVQPRIRLEEEEEEEGGGTEIRCFFDERWYADTMDVNPDGGRVEKGRPIFLTIFEQCGYSLEFFVR